MKKNPLLQVKALERQNKALLKATARAAKTLPPEGITTRATVQIKPAPESTGALERLCDKIATQIELATMRGEPAREIKELVDALVNLCTLRLALLKGNE